MSTSRLDYYLNLGKSHDLSGAELIAFAKQMVNDERDDRAREREQKEFEAKLQQEQESLEHARQMDLRKLELERLRIETEAKLRLEEITAKNQERNSVISDSETSLAVQNTNWFGRRFDLGIGHFDNNAENLDAFVNRFEAIAKSYELPTKLWAIEFSKALQGTALQTYELLDTECKMDYDCLI